MGLSSVKDKNSQSGAIHLLLLVASIGIVAYFIFSSFAPFKGDFFSRLYSKSGVNAAGETTFTPQVIPMSDAEISNPLRGALNQFQYFNFPPGWPAVDQYERPTWKDVEPTRDNYNYGIFDSMLTRAQNGGG